MIYKYEINKILKFFKSFKLINSKILEINNKYFMILNDKDDRFIDCKK